MFSEQPVAASTPCPAVEGLNLPNPGKKEEAQASSRIKNF